MNIQPANNTEGCLIYVHGSNTHVFRVYSGGTFKDYDLLHCDLCVKITDVDAAFYDNGVRLTLDHSPETLGIKEDKDVQ